MKGWIEDFKEWKKREKEAIDNQACILGSELREFLKADILKGAVDDYDKGMNQAYRNVLNRFCEVKE